jgi:hypothetical protein
MKQKSHREIITETSKRFKHLVKSGADTSVAYNFYLATLKIDLKPTTYNVN